MAVASVQTAPVRWSSVRYYGRPARPRSTAPTVYAPGLDGVRALAVAAVVAYHLGARWLPGGFLGVDVFFVLSGFLITSLLAAEWRASGGIAVGQFYLRRARRLLPALYLMLAVVVVTANRLAPGQLRAIRSDVPAALGYVTNWTLIARNGSYFAAGGPSSPLQHLWSLAVEEQFYLLWPLALLACLWTRRRWLPLAVVVVGAAASTCWMGVQYMPGTDPSRVYYGSDTHAAPLLVGAALALACGERRVRARWADLAALVAVLVLGYALVHASYNRAELFRGGYLVVALAAAALVHAAAGATGTARLLGVRPLRWLGQRSYAIYLWHWPIIVLLHPSIGAWLVPLQIAATLLLAGLSYRLVEDPIRKRGLRTTLCGTRSPVRRVLVGAAAFGIAGLAAGQLAAVPAYSAAAIAVDPHARPTVIIAVPTVHPLAAPGSPRRAPFQRPVRVAFFGDSQGMTLLINRPAGLGRFVTLTDDTIEGCGVLGGTITSSSGQVRDLEVDCGGWLRTWADRARRDRPQIAVIEIGAWEVFDDRVAGTELPFGTHAWDAYLERQLSAGITALTASGAQVALLGVPCYQPISAGGLQALPERGDRSRTGHLDSLLRAVARRDPRRVFYVRPPQQFCTDPAVVGNTAYRWDGVHFYKPGAALEFEVITPQLLAIPQRPA
jgi:peptidoglycan/LPS O-acetylase OafA/YrhL